MQVRMPCLFKPPENSAVLSLPKLPATFGGHNCFLLLRGMQTELASCHALVATEQSISSILAIQTKNESCLVHVNLRCNDTAQVFHVCICRDSEAAWKRLAVQVKDMKCHLKSHK